MEDLPSGIQQDSIKPNSGSEYLWLCKIAVSTKPTVRYARNTEAVVYDDESWDPMAMQVGGQARSGEGEIPDITLQVTRCNEVLYDIIASTQGAIGADVQLIKVNSEHLDTPIAALEADFELLASQADSNWMYFTLGVPNPLYQPFPLLDFSSSVCPYAKPDLFKSVRCGYAGGDSTCTGLLEDCITKSNETMWGGEIGMDPAGMGI